MSTFLFSYNVLSLSEKNIINFDIVPCFGLKYPPLVGNNFILLECGVSLRFIGVDLMCPPFFVVNSKILSIIFK